MPDFSDFLEIQTKTAWGRTLKDFAVFCSPQTASVMVDVGTGPGLLPLIFTRQGMKAFGVDIDRHLLSSGVCHQLAGAHALQLPFAAATFDMLTAVNLLFLLENPLQALVHWRKTLKKKGQLCLLNPTEHLSLAAAEKVADQRGLKGVARDSLLGWAHNAETHARWTEAQTQLLLSEAGFKMVETALKIGPGFARYSRAIVQ